MAVDRIARALALQQNPSAKVDALEAEVEELKKEVEELKKQISTEKGKLGITTFANFKLA